jgi:hypothetical protein
VQLGESFSSSRSRSAFTFRSWSRQHLRLDRDRMRGPPAWSPRRRANRPSRPAQRGSERLVRGCAVRAEPSGEGKFCGRTPAPTLIRPPLAPVSAVTVHGRRQPMHPYTREMISGQVRVRLDEGGWIPDADLKQLAEELGQAGFEATTEEPPGRVPAFTPWDIVVIFADDAAKAALGALVKTVLDWARRRWRKSERRDHLVTIYGPNGEVLKRMHVEGEEPHELSTPRQLRKAERRASKNHWRRQRE